MGLWINNLFDQPFISIIEHNSMILIILFLRKRIQKKMLQYMHEKYCFLSFLEIQGAKKIIFSACQLGKLMLAFTSPNMISTSPKRVLMSRIDFTVLLQFEFHKKHHLPIGQVKNRIFTSPKAKSTSPRLSDTTFFALWNYTKMTLTFCNDSHTY